MSSVSRYHYITARFSWIVLVITIVIAGCLYLTFQRFPSIIAINSNPPADLPRRLGAFTNAPSDWTLFQSRDGSDGAYGGLNSRRFRLAGTFFEYVSDVVGVGDIRHAIIDDIRKGAQVIVREGEMIDDVRVIKIFKDRVVIRDATGTDDQLWLTFSGLGLSSKSTSGTNSTENTALLPGNADRFGGQQIAENKWVFNRQKLLDYYKELRDEPERLVKVFDSFKPVYSSPGSITGYKIGIEGEADFFKSVGLTDGDIVKSVNSMQMTSRRRAEYLLSEFISDRANTFLLEVDHGSGAATLRYDVR